MDAEESGWGVTLRLRQRPAKEQVVFGKLMGALAMMNGPPWPEFQIELLEDRTVDIPLSVIARAVQNILDVGGWRPDIGELLAACEKARIQIRGELPFQRCEQCSVQGWTEREIDGVKRMVRCDCWHAHQEKVKALGVPDRPLALPAARESEEGA